MLDALEQPVLRFLQETLCLLLFIDTRIKRKRPYEHTHGTAQIGRMPAVVYRAEQYLLLPVLLC